MKTVIIALLLVLVACNQKQSNSDNKPPRNYAEEMVMFTEPDSKCQRVQSPTVEDMDKKAHSVVCRFPNKVVTFCLVNGEGMMCRPLAGVEANQEQQQAQQAQVQQPVPPQMPQPQPQPLQPPQPMPKPKK